MSKRRRSTAKFRKRHPKEVGKFYRISDKKGGHPVRIYFKDEGNDVYFIQRFTSEGRKDRKKLSHNIDPQSKKEQWLVKKPEAVGFDNMFYESRYETFRIHPDDIIIVLRYQKHNLRKKKNR